MDEPQQRNPERGNDGADKRSGSLDAHQAQTPEPPPWGAFDPYAAIMPRKRKWVAGVLSLCIPGTGHFYLGLMQKGLMIMLLIIMDIFAIVHFSINMSSIPLITLLALFLPIIYFYSLFDALQSVDKVNAYRYSISAFPNGDPGPNAGTAAKPGSPTYIGWLLVGCGGLFFVFSAKPDWIGMLLDKMGTMVGGLVLIGIGIVVFLRNSSKPK
ncbi:hypothetical protein FE784_31495 [Paenibacillus hemerocallicola]|uniref:Uncharacterized protein n=1 Tax=Paenibacillus hemerocallicola TaxID=1172614 RepID=A0A5C4SZV9_9BACL|nr:hypothetical protein [Paenibacillus hemerocallicola]TNJ62311.1 hypothetical protein FE784_31495 [Paenibacillus hemerocallicola]